ncbi:monocarboxylate transporter 12-like isoform X2 [Portunus trituberculatus]|uniref:monocarboxylate transporter 12-like isoform X2 n=1 Tax=Portunus trituberculatus TaxID=210409 RepID=UPI001E1D0DD9|nr:monocarboxylate transporter 12-like isoform X2 [Portunus trituberculatus]
MFPAAQESSEHNLKEEEEGLTHSSREVGHGKAHSSEKEHGTAHTSGEEKDGTAHSLGKEEDGTAHSSGEEEHGTAHSSWKQQDQGQNEGQQSIHAMIPMSLCPESPTPPSARDRGYAWVVVAGVFWINTLCAGYIKSFGITYLLLLQYFPDDSAAAVGWVMGMLLGTRGLLAPVMGAMAVKIGPRRSILIGTLLITLGLLLAIPKLSIYYMAATVGSLVGIGICMSETPGILLVTDYFVERLSFANGIRASGNPMGGFLFSPMVVFFNEQFGLQGTFILLAGVMMHIAVFGMLMRPLELQEQILYHQHLRKIRASSEYAEKCNEKAAAVTHKTLQKKALDFTLLWNPKYLLYIVMVLFTNLSMPQFLLYLPAYGHSVGLTNYQNSIISSYLSATDCIFRISCGFLVHKLNVKETFVFPVGLVVGGLSCFLVTFCSAMWQLMLVTTLYSIGLATFWALINTLLVNDFGPKSVATSWGFFRMTQGITNFIYPSLLGLMQDLTQSLMVPFFIMGTGLILGSAVFTLRPFIAKISKGCKE